MDFGLAKAMSGVTEMAPQVDLSVFHCTNEIQVGRRVGRRNWNHQKINLETELILFITTEWDGLHMKWQKPKAICLRCDCGCQAMREHQVGTPVKNRGYTSANALEKRPPHSVKLILCRFITGTNQQVQTYQICSTKHQTQDVIRGGQKEAIRIEIGPSHLPLHKFAQKPISM